MAFQACCCLAVLLALAPAWARNQSQGFSSFVVEGSRVRGSVSLLAADYQQLVGLDPNEDHVITPQEAAVGESALGIFASRRCACWPNPPTEPSKTASPRTSPRRVVTASSTRDM